jgi:hypothetical protein
MGTFIIRPIHLASGGTPICDGAGVIPVPFSGWSVDGYPTFNIIDAMRAVSNDNGIGGFFNCDATFFDNGAFNDTIRFDFTGSAFYLDGSLIPIPFASLPSGIRPLTATLSFVNEFGVSGTATFQLEQASGVLGVALATSFAYDFTFPAPTMEDIYLDGCGLKVSLPIAGDSLNVIYDLKVEGTYDILAFQYTIENGTTPLNPGDLVTITSDPNDPTALDFTQLGNADNSPINFTFVDNDGDSITIELPLMYILTITVNLLIFILPGGMGNIPRDGSGNGHPNVNGVGNGTQFSGTIALGTLVVHYANGSGIYKIVKNKRTDTVYNHDTTTREVAIPNPTALTGYIGG